MTERDDRTAPAEPGAAFAERYLAVDGFRIRCLEAGAGPPLVHLADTGDLRLSRAHDLLAERFRVIVCEPPGFDPSAPNEWPRSPRELAATMAAAIEALGLARYSLLGTSLGGTLALWLAVQHPDRLDALVLEAPVVDLSDPNRDAELARQLGDLQVPTLVLFGTRDRVTPPEVGRRYREKLPIGHFMLVYDAGHAIAADRPEAFTSLVSDFLERRAQFVVSRASTLLHP